MNNKSNLFKVLIPILAVVIIFESVVVVSRLVSKKPVMVADEESEIASTKEEQPEANIAFEFKTSNNEMAVGSEYNVVLSMALAEDVRLDAIDLLLSYDPSKMTVTSLSEAGKIVATSKRISEKSGSIVANFWSMDEAGYVYNRGESVDLISFTVKPIVTGEMEISVVEKSELGSTKLVSTAGEQVVVNNFVSQPLSVKAID